MSIRRKMLLRAYPGWVFFFFFCQLDTGKSHLERGASVEEISPLDGSRQPCEAYFFKFKIDMGRPSLLWVVLGVYEKSKLSKPREASEKRQQSSLPRLQFLPPVLALTSRDV